MDTASALLSFLDLDWLRQPADKGPGSLDWGTIQLHVYTAPPALFGDYSAAVAESDCRRSWAASHVQPGDKELEI